ncbi:cupin domain-containing protein [Niveispirillum sp.]|uniref:cupin domain-containing protein n=1 Tax=Niveispirillum sp. TaxID=1917217 RepID=UPI001B4121CE|nr:cupin domain-containing protein [Niveispirillum sp.]MBP7337593.1 cupin domain-containing protein [Niveispirillum sp.]
MVETNSFPIINLDSLAPTPFPEGHGPKGATAERFGPLIARIGPMIGARHLGCLLTVLPSGKAAFPFHNHRVNEEMFLILEGTGRLRLGADNHPLRPGDIVSCPPGDVSTAHQIINDGEVDLRYLSFSTMMSPDIVDYPDSGKIGFSHVGSGMRMITRPGATVDYWADE